MKASLYINNILSMFATDQADIRKLINRTFIRLQRGENVRLELNGETR